MILNDFINKMIKAKDRWAFWYLNCLGNTEEKRFLQNGGFKLVDNSTAGNVRIKIPAHTDTVMVKYEGDDSALTISGVDVDGNIINTLRADYSTLPTAWRHLIHKMFVFTNVGGGYISISHNVNIGNYIIFIRGL